MNGAAMEPPASSSKRSLARKSIGTPRRSRDTEDMSRFRQMRRGHHNKFKRVCASAKSIPAQRDSRSSFIVDLSEVNDIGKPSSRWPSSEDRTPWKPSNPRINRRRFSMRRFVLVALAAITLAAPTLLKGGDHYRKGHISPVTSRPRGTPAFPKIFRADATIKYESNPVGFVTCDGKVYQLAGDVLEWTPRWSPHRQDRDRYWKHL